MGRFTDYGFERDPLQTIVAAERQKWKTRLGANGVDVDTENSLLNILSTITAESKFQADQIMEEAVSNLTIAGAEGVYLDNILGKVTPRAAPTASSVNALVEWNETSSQSQVVLTTTLFNTKDGKKLYPTQAVTLSESVVAFQIQPHIWNSLPDSTNVTFTIVRGGVSHSQSFNTSLAWTAVSTSIYNWLVSTVGISASLIYFPVTSYGIYAGYTSITNVVGVGSKLTVLCSNNLIKRVSEVTVQNEKACYSPIAANTISSMSPTFTGYNRTFNIAAGSPGSNAESDAAYYLRYQRLTNDPKAVTREGLERALLESGISKVSVVNGAEPYTGRIYVVGNPTDGRTIGKVINDSKPIGYVTYGSSSETITSSYSGGISEIIYWSVATPIGIDINVTYQTNGGILTTTEQEEIRNIINDVISSLMIGASFYTSQLDTSIIRATTSSRIVFIQCFVKRTTDSSYSNGLISLVGTNQYYIVPDLVTNIIFTQL